jgi:hypothetical protein
MRYVMFFLVAAMLSSCTPWRSSYLIQVNNHATQDDIVVKLGPPDRKQPLSNGKEIWAYRYSGSSVSSYGGNVSGESWCREYILTFDQSKILRDWVRQRC